MPVKNYKPYTPSRRFISNLDFGELSKVKPHKKLTVAKKKTGGRNNNGRITVRFNGGGHKQNYRLIDLKRDKITVPGRVVSIEYDPNRSGWIALISYLDGEKKYILAPVGLNIGDLIVAGANCDIKPGNSTELINIPVGTMIHNIELRPGKGGQLVRSAGASAQLMAKEGDYVQVKLPSGEVRLIHRLCKATVGQVSNVEHENIVLGKAGKSRWLGRKPHNRGVVMNPVDHPHGGGEGKTSGGRHPVTPWGKPTRGFRTRNNKRTDRFIVRKK